MLQSNSRFLVIEQEPSLNSYAGQPPSMSRWIKSTSAWTQTAVVLLSWRHMLITVPTYGHRHLTAIRFELHWRPQNDRMIGPQWSGERLLTSIFLVWQPERADTSRGRTQCQNGPESHYDIRVGVKCILPEWRFNDGHQLARSGADWRTRLEAAAHLASTRLWRCNDFIAVRTAQNLKRDVDRRYGKTLMTSCCQQVRSLRRSERDLIASSVVAHIR